MSNGSGQACLQDWFEKRKGPSGESWQGLWQYLIVSYSSGINGKGQVDSQLELWKMYWLGHGESQEGTPTGVEVTSGEGHWLPQVPFLK